MAAAVQRFAPRDFQILRDLLRDHVEELILGRRVALGLDRDEDRGCICFRRILLRDEDRRSAIVRGDLPPLRQAHPERTRRVRLEGRRSRGDRRGDQNSQRETRDPHPEFIARSPGPLLDALRPAGVAKLHLYSRAVARALRQLTTACSCTT